MRRLFVLVLAFLVPPALMFFVARARASTAITGLWIVAQLLFWFVFAGPGLLLALLSSVAAAWIVLSTPRTRFADVQSLREQGASQ